MLTTASVNPSALPPAILPPSTMSSIVREGCVSLISTREGSITTVDTADYKANTTLSFRIDGVDLVERSKTRPPPGPIGKLPRLLLAQGGVLIKAGDEIVGAIGISGARGNNMDTACARAGVDKIKDRLR